MKFKIKSISAIILLLCLTTPVIGVYIWIEIKKEINRRSVFRTVLKNLPEEELTTFKFSNTDARLLLSWEEDYEFEYQDNMYDVVSMEYQNDSVLIICWGDEKETRLNKSVKELVKGVVNQNPVDNKAGNNVIKLLKSLYIQKNSMALMSSQIKTNHQIPLYINHYKGIIQLVSSPPPKQTS